MSKILRKASIQAPQITAAPPLATEVAIVCVCIAFGLLVAWAAPDVKAWIKGEPPVTSGPAQCSQLEARAASLASIVVTCLNNGHCLEAR